MEKEEMENARIAHAIPGGGRNIELMRHEIHITVTTVLGLIEGYDGNQHDGEITYYGYRWSIHPSAFRGAVVSCRQLDQGQEKVVYNSLAVSRNKSSIPLEHVQRVFEVSGYFIKLMYELFPTLPEKVRPLVEAAGLNPEFFR